MQLFYGQKPQTPHTSRELPSVAFLWFNNIKLCLWIKMRYKRNMTILEQVYIFRLAFFLIEHYVQLRFNWTRYSVRNYLIGHDVQIEIIRMVGGKAYLSVEYIN